MSQIAASTKGVQKDNIRVIPIQQVVPNPQTSSPGNPYGNTILVKFPYVQSFSQCEIALGNLYCFYSWFNIMASFGNNTFSYNWPNSSGGYTNYPVTVPDGFYQIDDLNNYFQQVQLDNGTYLLTSSTNSTPVFFLTWASNVTFYATTVTSMVVPSAAVNPNGYVLPADYAPAAGGALPPTPSNPQLVILPTSAPAGSNTPGLYSFSKSLGISPGTYPPTNVGVFYNINGQFSPIIESTSNIYVTCNLVNTNALTPFAKVLYTFSPTVAFGSQIQEKPFFPLFMQVADGYYQDVVITLRDENYQPLNIRDAHISLVLLIRGI
jgi:hypothetical protein